MYDPYPPYGPPPRYAYDWHPPQRRRRLNGKGVTVVLIAFALLCAGLLGVVKLGLLAWNAPLTPKLADSAVNIATAAADGAMKDAKVPDPLRSTATNEAEVLRQEILHNAVDVAQQAAR